MSSRWTFPVRKNRASLPRKKKSTDSVHILPDISDFAAFRRRGIGGSDAPVVMEKSKWMTPAELLLIKTGQTQPDPPNFPMLRGIQLEPIARAHYELETGIAMPAGRAIHPKLNFVRGNFDGINSNEKKILEIKCPGHEDHWKALNGEIPEHYIFQLVHLLLVTGFKHCDYFSYDWKTKTGITIPFERSRRLEIELLDRERDFWNQVQKGKKMSEPRKPQNGSQFSAREVVEILERARELGVSQLKLDGFEAAFDPSLGLKNGPAPRKVTRQEFCTDCDSEMIPGKNGLYCKPCYIRWKEWRK